MEIKSTTRYARFSPKKGRDVAREIVGLSVSDAIDVLTYTPKKAAFLLNKTLKTAVADAENNFNLDAENLVVKSASVTAGSSLRRFKPRARGSASAIKKRSSHITVTVVESVAPAQPVKKANKKTVSQGPVNDEKLGLVYKSAPQDVDDLKKISGVGPVLEQKLNDAGLYKYEQIINWTPENISNYDELLSFKGRIERENWVEQAKTLQEEKSN